jgi:hypothetical protein
MDRKQIPSTLLRGELMHFSLYLSVPRALILDPRWEFLPPFLRVLSFFLAAMVSHSTHRRGQNGEVFIAVIGVTGAGKTTFISRATGRSDLEIGHSIDSCKSTGTHHPPPPVC